ncbi:MAG TPA: hypothetical protein VF717_13375 [Pyrinomonadaceae bacterium]
MASNRDGQDNQNKRVRAAASLYCSSRPSLPIPFFRKTLWPLLILALVCGTGAGPSPAQTGPYAESPEVAAWVKERVTRARSGRRELVRLPLVRRSDGWGCICPYYYVGLSTATAAGSTWIEPRFERPAQGFSKNMIVLAEGYFTGKRLRRDLRTNPSQPEEWIYNLWEFRVRKVYLLPDGHDFYDEDSPRNRVRIVRSYSGARRRIR